jgi:hypothetical protein
MIEAPPVLRNSRKSAGTPEAITKMEMKIPFLARRAALGT